MAKEINKVTTRILNLALRLCNINLSTSQIDKIIDIVELIEKKGSKITIDNITDLQAKWKLIKY